MTKYRSVLLTLGLLVCFTPTARAQLSGHGVIDLSPVSFCLQGQYFLVDPCTGSRVLMQSSTINLGSLLCESGQADGPDVGIECPVIEVQSFVPQALSCTLEVRDTEARQISTGATVLLWPPVLSPSSACVTSYDVIRGRSSLVTPGDLGDVICLENDSTDTTTFGDSDPEPPQPGELFFYLVRPNGPLGSANYGGASSGAVRRPTTGDCPPTTR